MALLTLYWTLDVFLIFVGVVVAMYFYMTRKFNHWNKKGVTEIRPVPLFGNLLDSCLLRTTPGSLFKSWYEQGKGLPYVGFYIFDKPALLLRDPDLIKAVMVKDFNYFANRYLRTHELDTLGSANPFLAHTPQWISLRQRSTSTFTSGRMKRMFSLMLAVGNELIDHLDALGLQGDGRDLEAKEISAKFTTDVIFSCAFGLQAKSINDPNSPFTKAATDIFGFATYLRSAEVASFFFAPAIVKLLKLQWFSKEAGDFLRRVFMETMQLRISDGVERNDLIDLLIQLKKSQKGDSDASEYDDDVLVAQATTFFAAGFETSSSTMAFTLYELALNPDVQSRLRSEITLALEEGEGEITYEMVTKLPYLDKVICETLRKYPPLPFLDRVAAGDYKVPGTDLIIEEGTPVYIPLLGTHYDPEYFPDPTKYDPERFSAENKQKRPFGVYAPFGEGPRNCVGLRFGLLQSKLGVAKFLLNYEVAPCSKTMVPIQFDPKAVLLVSNGRIFLNVRKITSTQ